MSRPIWMVLVAAFALVGCNLANSQDSQFDDARNPFYKQAQQDLDNNNFPAAAEDFESALRANPKLPGANYQLGVLYGDKINDPVASIYHYKKFLELVPTSDKTDQVNAAIQKQSQAFAASLPNSSSGADDAAKLQGENATLQKQVADEAHTIAQLQKQLSKHHITPVATPATASVPPPPATPTTEAAPPPPAAAIPPLTPAPAPVVPATPAVAADASAPAAAPAPATPPRALPVDLAHPDASATPAAAGAPGTPPVISTAGGRTYKIVSGDSLWKISHKMYPGDTKNGIDKIKEANKDTLIDGKPLKIGQVLIIPD